MKQIDGISFHELDSERYWSYAKNYKGNKQLETKNMILSGEYVGSVKQDGHYSRLIKDMDGNIRLQGRSESVNGGYLDKHEWTPQLQKFFDAIPNGTCLLGELYFPSQRGSRKVTTILGCLKEKAVERQEKGDKLHYYVFDVWAFAGKSCLDCTIEERIEYLECLKEINECDFVEIASYYEGNELWEKLGKILSSGGEGVVITRKGSKPEPGKRTARKTLKVKMEIENTIDAFLTGNYKPATRLYTGKTPLEDWFYWENVRTGERITDRSMVEEYSNGGPYEPVTRLYALGYAGSVEFAVFDGDKVVPIGWISGIIDDLRRDIVDDPTVQGKVAELTCMEVEHIDGNYSMRHGKIKTWREDKTPRECTFDQIVSQVS